MFSFSSVLTEQAEVHTLQAYRQETQSIIAAAITTSKTEDPEREGTSVVRMKKWVESDSQEEIHVHLGYKNNYDYYSFKIFPRF